MDCRLPASHSVPHKKVQELPIRIAKNQLWTFPGLVSAKVNSQQSKWSIYPYRSLALANSEDSRLIGWTHLTRYDRLHCVHSSSFVPVTHAGNVHTKKKASEWGIVNRLRKRCSKMERGWECMCHEWTAVHRNGPFSCPGRHRDETLKWQSEPYLPLGYPRL